MIHFTIVNNSIKFELDDGNRGANTGIHQKVLLQVSVRELHIDMLKKYSTGFSMAYDKKRIVFIRDYALQLILPHQLRNMTQRHTIICGCKTCIQAVICQKYFNNWHKIRLQFIKNSTKQFMSGSDEQ